MVPLRSGNAVIGTLEVAGRLGDLSHFNADDVRVVETLAAHVGVAVENSRLVDRLRYDANYDALTGLPNRRRLVGALGEVINSRTPGEVGRRPPVRRDRPAQRQRVARAQGRQRGAQRGGAAGCGRSRRPRRWWPASAATSSRWSLRVADLEAALALADEIRAGPARADAVRRDGRRHRHHGRRGGPPRPRRRPGTAGPAGRRGDPRGQGRRRLAERTTPAWSRARCAASASPPTCGAASTSDEIEVYFQPKVALADRRVVGVECLARWEHPVYGAVTPGGLRRGGRAHRPDRPAHRPGAAAGAAPGPGVGRRRAGAVGVGQRVAAQPGRRPLARPRGRAAVRVRRARPTG